MKMFFRSLLLLLMCWASIAQAADTGWLRNAQNSHAEVRLRSATLGYQQQLLLDIRL